MPDQGFIPLYRKFFKSRIWELEKNKPFHKREAWLDLLQLAQYKDGPKLVNYKNVQLKKGQVLTSILKLSERWKWSRVKVRAFLKFLETEEKNICIENGHQKGRSFTIITLLNYSYYHDYNLKKDTQKDNKKTIKRHSKDTYNKENKDNNVNKKRETTKTTEIETQIVEIYEHWNSLSLKKHTEITDKMRTALTTCLKKNKIEVVKQSITNYEKVLTSDNFWTHKYRLEDFIKRGFEKFSVDFDINDYNNNGDLNAPDDKNVPEFMPGLSDPSGD